jgi:hypothetical protein
VKIYILKERNKILPIYIWLKKMNKFFFELPIVKFNYHKLFGYVREFTRKAHFNINLIRWPNIRIKNHKVFFCSNYYVSIYKKGNWELEEKSDQYIVVHTFWGIKLGNI